MLQTTWFHLHVAAVQYLIFSWMISKGSSHWSAWVSIPIQNELSKNYPYQFCEINDLECSLWLGYSKKCTAYLYPIFPLFYTVIRSFEWRINSDEENYENSNSRQPTYQKIYNGGIENGLSTANDIHLYST